MKIQTTRNFSSEKLKILVYGDPGVGKTSLAKTIDGTTLIVSAEAGLLSLNDASIDVIDITQDDEGQLIPKEKRLQRLGEVYQYLLTQEARNKYEWIFIDSLSEISQNIMDALYLEFPEKNQTLPMYGENSKRLRSLIKSFRDLPHYNVVFTALAATEKDENNVRITGVSVVGNVADKLPAWFDEVFYMAVIESPDTEEKNYRVLVTGKSEKVIAKDRSGKLDKIEKPDLAIIAKKIKGEL